MKIVISAPGIPPHFSVSYHICETDTYVFEISNMPTAVLTGCNSGIGHAWARILIDEGYQVYALDITVGEKLKALEGPSCKIARLDVTSVESVQDFKKSFGDQPLDVLLNIAGIMPKKEKDNLDDLTLGVMESTFAINAYGPVLLTQALVPNVLASSGPRRIAVMSSRVGSIADNTSGGYLAYRASKTAVNSFFKTIAIDLQKKDVVVSMLHPGFTKTNLDPDIWNIPGVVEPEEAASKLWALLQTKTMNDTGKFWHRDGMELPW